jgi:hypothetical protein
VASYTTALTTQSGWKHVGYIVKTAYLYGYTLGGWAYPNGVPTWDPYLQTYASIQVNFYYSYQVKVITTDWVVYRSTAKNDGGTKSFEWSVHASGYYRVITNSQVVYSHYLQVGTGTITQNISTIIGDVPAADAGIISDSKSLFEPQVGAYSSGSRFPYSNGETRSTTGTIVTS